MAGESDIAGELALLTQGVEEVREKLVEEGIKRDKRIATNEAATKASRTAARNATFAAALAVLVGAIGIVVGGVGIKNGIDANNDRKQRTIAACEQFNRQQSDQTIAEISQSHDLIAALSKGAPKGSATDAAVKAYNDRHDTLIRGEHRLRDCSPEGLARYYAATTQPKAKK